MLGEIGCLADDGHDQSMQHVWKVNQVGQTSLNTMIYIDEENITCPIPEPHMFHGHQEPVSSECQCYHTPGWIFVSAARRHKTPT